MKNSNINHLINLFIIFLFCLKYLECSECTSCILNHFGTYRCLVRSGFSTCSSYCKPKYNVNNCYECSTNGLEYYTIDINGNCHTKECIGDKIIAGTGECTFQTITTLFKLGDFYYTSISSGTLYSCNGNICDCSSTSYYSIEKIYGKKKLTCHGTSIPSSYKYCNSKTLECFTDGCPSGFTIMKRNGIPNGITRCSDTCEPDEWYISIEDTITHAITEYCVDSCSDNTHTPDSSYKFEYINNGNKRCVNDCPTGSYKIDKTNKHSCVPRDQCTFYISNSYNCYDSCPSGNLYHNYGSQECISGCTVVEYLYKNNNICYRKEDCNFIDENTSSFKCIRSPSSCSSHPYHDYNSKLCLSSCGQNNGINIYRAEDKYICYSSCADIPGYYIYEQIENSNTDKICYTLKPSSDCEVYYQKTDGVLKCITKSDCVNNLKYNYILGYECRISCDGYYKFEYTESSLTYIKCFETLEDALSDSYHVKFCDTIQKKCWKNFPTDETYYIVSVISSSYTDRYKVTKECSTYYYLKTGSTDTSLNNYWCVEDCKKTNPNLYFLRGNKKCLDSCKDVFKYYYDPANNECLDSCELRPSKPFSYSITNSNPEECLTACASTRGQFYSYNSHICLDNCNDDRSDNLYYAVGSKVCYPSCLDIPGGVYKYEYRDNSCSTTEPNDSTNCPYYYIKSNGIIKCAIADDCRDLNYFYLLGDECKKTCEDFYYKLDITLRIASDDVPFIKCFLTPSECQQSGIAGVALIYYNAKLRQCWKDYKEGYFVKEIDTTKNELVEECENFYYVRDISGQERNYCTLTCNAVNTDTLYFLKGIKKCEKTCKNFNKFYYDPLTRECLDSCEGIANYPFQEEPTGPNFDPLPCISSCAAGTTGKPYHNFDSNICLERCGADGSNKKYHKYGDFTCYSSCIEIPDGLYLYEYLEDGTHDVYSCHDSLPTTHTGNCPYYYLKNDGTKKCQTAEECKNRNYIYLLYGECRDRCDEYYKIEKPISLGSGTIYTFFSCYLTSHECYTNDNTNGDPIYFFEKNKRCWKQFPTGYFIKTTPTTENELIEKCEKYYYVDNSNRNICTEACKISPGQNLFFIEGNNKCETDCINFGKNYYDPSNNECLDTCEGRNTYKFQEAITGTITSACLEVCPQSSPSLPYHNSDSNVCIASCTGNKKYHINNEYICYSSCAEIPAAEYVYEYNDICYSPPLTISGSCDYYYTKSDGTRKCTTKTDCINNMNFNIS